MEEIRTQAEKYIEAKDNLADHLKAERQPLIPQAKAQAHTREEIRESTKIKTTFGRGSSARTVLVPYMVVNTWASYSMIIGRLTLNKLRVVVPTPHLYMKYLAGKEVGIIRADQKVACCCYKDNLKVGRRIPNHNRVDGSYSSINFLDLDSHQHPKDRRPWSTDSLKEVQIGPCRMGKTKIGIALDGELKEKLIPFLTENRDIFAWTLVDMPGIDPDILCCCLSIAPRARSIVQKRRQLREESEG
ncbi:hypothetical protein CR513_56103, partial [Mucuna pruriens]